MRRKHRPDPERIDLGQWLLRPKAPVTRFEVYTLLRQYHQEQRRERLRTMAGPLRALYALWLIVSSPVRLLIRAYRRRRAARLEGRAPGVAQADE